MTDHPLLSLLHRLAYLVKADYLMSKLLQMGNGKLLKIATG